MLVAEVVLEAQVSECGLGAAAVVAKWVFVVAERAAAQLLLRHLSEVGPSPFVGAESAAAADVAQRRMGSYQMGTRN